MDKDDDLILSGSSDITLDITNQGAACDTLTINDLNYDTIDLGGISMNTVSGVTSPINQYYIDTTTSPSFTISSGGYSYNTNYSFDASDPRVNIDNDGVHIKGDRDLKIGDRSLKDFMDKVEDQLAILRPAPELEEKWDQLKDLRRQYEALKQDILEKEKIMEILKRS